MKLIKFIMITIIIFNCCDHKNNRIKIHTKKDKNIAKLIENNTELEKDFLKIDTMNFLSSNLLIGVKENLKRYSSLNIAGFRLFELNRKGNITATYDISNNYSLFYYDKKNRIIKSENRNHHPPELYFKVEYIYNDSTIKVIKTKYKNDKSSKKVVIEKFKNGETPKGPFSIDKENNYYFNNEKLEIITYKNDMIFCCGRMMEGKNRLTYYLRNDKLIDSLVVSGIESNKELKFKYEYKN